MLKLYNDVNPEKILTFNRQIPRYTSYPTAPFFEEIESDVYVRALQKFDQSTKPLSLYVHIPFCRSMCLFCACSVVLNRKKEKQQSYLYCLLQEIKKVSSYFQTKREISQLHFGGGTPTALSEEEFSLLFESLNQHFSFTKNAEISIEVDPRTVFEDQGKKLIFLRKFFSRVSFGVQDLDPKVQEAVKRRQSEEMTVMTYRLARELNFLSINVDLIYGLPLQSVTSFQKTAEKIIHMNPDRIAFFSYAKVPWLKPHQKAIEQSTLPKDLEKFQIYAQARKLFLENGYEAIGMDHFAKSDDSLYKGFLEKKLQRNFQGYTLKLADDLIGFGVSSIGFIEETYVQNAKEISVYSDLLSEQGLPISKGKISTFDDRVRYWTIQRIMCDFVIDKKEFETLFSIPFDIYFQKENILLKGLEQQELIYQNSIQIQATEWGELFVRNIACVFDQYLQKKQQKQIYSQSI